MSEWKNIFDDYVKSVGRMQEALEQTYSVLTRDASIKRFELSFELSWKLLKAFLDNQGFLCNSPRKCLEQAFSFGVVEDDPLWLAMMNDRNSAVHTYDEDFANALYSRLPDYLKLFQALKMGVKEYY